MAALLFIVETISSNTTWFCGEIELDTRFITNPTSVELIFLNTILNPILILTDRLGIYNPGLCNFDYKTYAGRPKT